MRELGMSEMWPKLDHDEFTTFRFPRRDRDWEAGENVKVVFKPRSRERKVLGIAWIRSIEPRKLIGSSETTPPGITQDEAIADGFKSHSAMLGWLAAHNGLPESDINKLTLRWFKRE